VASVPHDIPSPSSGTARPLAARLGRAVASLRPDDLPGDVVPKVKLCLYDLIGCVFESRHLPWSRQASALATPCAAGDGATLIGTSRPVGVLDAAFANAVMGHGLVREDMHSGSISHLGIVVLPALLALCERHRVGGADFIAAAVAGYEAGGWIGRIAMDARVARIHRPTGITGPIAGAAAAARLLGLSADAATMAIALGTNATAGFNQWAHTGGSEMFFQAGFASRNAVAVARLAALGAFASPDAIDGEAGLLAALGKAEPPGLAEPFAGEPEILSVYHKPVPACNFAQTPCQAALAIARREAVDPARIAAISVAVPRAGALYPGCDSRGPFRHVLQAKMSIQFNVAAALLHGAVSERNFEHLDDPRLARLVSLTTLRVDDELTARYPRLQGAQVEVTDAGGGVHRARLDDVVNAGRDEILARFRASVSAALGDERAARVEAAIEGLDAAADAAALPAALRADAHMAEGARPPSR
jgi:2-methylcitrate dehydratase PrpD